jgi:hypothetical protein
MTYGTYYTAVYMNIKNLMTYGTYYTAVYLRQKNKLVTSRERGILTGITTIT